MGLYRHGSLYRMRATRAAVESGPRRSGTQRVKYTPFNSATQYPTDAFLGRVRPGRVAQLRRFSSQFRHCASTEKKEHRRRECFRKRGQPLVVPRTLPQTARANGRVVRPRQRPAARAGTRQGRTPRVAGIRRVGRRRTRGAKTRWVDTWGAEKTRHGGSFRVGLRRLRTGRARPGDWRGRPRRRAVQPTCRPPAPREVAGAGLASRPREFPVVRVRFGAAGEVAGGPPEHDRRGRESVGVGRPTRGPPRRRRPCGVELQGRRRARGAVRWPGTRTRRVP